MTGESIAQRIASVVDDCYIEESVDLFANSDFRCEARDYTRRNIISYYGGRLILFAENGELIRESSLWTHYDFRHEHK